MGTQRVSRGRLGVALFVAMLYGCGGSGGSGGDGPSTPEPFRLLMAEALSPSQVRLTFSHALDPATASRADQFHIDGLPHFGASIDPVDSARVLLDTFFQLDDSYSVQALSARSAAGQSMQAGGESASFSGAGASAQVRMDLNPPADLAGLLADGWSVVDDPGATNDAPSAWAVSLGTVQQTSNIYGGMTDPWVADRPGTYLVHDASAIQDGFIQAVVEAGDDDALGLIVRYSDPENFYRFEWDRQRRRQRLVRVQGGVSTVLAFDTAQYALDTQYEVVLMAVGSRLAAMVDGVVILSTRDVALTSGAAGVFCWGVDDLRIRDVVVAAVAGELSSPSGPPDLVRPDAPRATHSPAANDPASDSVRLWIRASEACDVHWEVSTTDDFSSGTMDSPAQPSASASDFTVSHEVGGLLADTQYYARAILVDPLDTTRRNASEIVSFQTAPTPAASEDVLFAFGADFHQEYPERLPILNGLAARGPAFFLSLGDFPYADVDPAPATLETYRYQHRLVRSYEEVESCFRQVPLVATWDDHEVANDWSATTAASLVAIGTQVWAEYFPFRSTVGSGGANYRSFRWGSALEVFLLDTRLHRSANGAADDASKTMLGTTQKQWLLQGLSASTATFKVIATSVPLRYGTTGDDHWEGFTTERTEILSHITSNLISGVFFLAGDQHWASAHHHPEGLVEVMACPISAELRDPPAVPPPEVVFVRKDYCYGLVRIDATAATCAIEIYDKDDLLIHTESLP